MLPTPDRSQLIRASDAERERYIVVLRTQCADGRLSLDEFSERVERVYAAQVRRDLDEVVADLPVPWHSSVRAQATAATVRDKIQSRRWHVAVFGTTVRRGSYRLTSDTASVAVFGDCTLDLTRAQLADPEVRIDAVAVFGTVTVIVPPDLDVVLEGAAIFGDKSLNGPDRSLPGSSTLVVRAIAVFGDVRVRRVPAKDPTQRRRRRGG